MERFVLTPPSPESDLLCPIHGVPIRQCWYENSPCNTNRRIAPAELAS